MAKKPATTDDDKRDEAVDAQAQQVTAADETGRAGALTLRPELMSEFVDIGEDSSARIIRRITIPVLPLDVDSPDAIAINRTEMTIAGRVVEAIHEGKALASAKYPTPVKLITLESVSGTQVKIVVSAVLKSELEAAYKGDAYVGSWFRITKFRKKHAKQYNTFDIIEIEKPRKLTTMTENAHVAIADQSAA